MQTRPLDLDTLQLARGSHPNHDAMCIMEPPEALQRLRLRADGKAARGQSVAVRLWGRCTITQSGCWEFDGARSTDGYGSIRCGGKQSKTHRVAWMLANGDPGTLCVLHRCDNPPCVNPAHLFLGTVAANNADRARKGRSRGVFGPDRRHPTDGVKPENNWRAKLTDADVVEMRSLRDRGASHKAIADRFGVHVATSSRICRGVWR